MSAAFQAASISKPVTAMAVLRAVQDGTFSLDADINTILKSWKVRRESTRRRSRSRSRLLSHTSGSGDGFGFPGYHPTRHVPPSSRSSRARNLERRAGRVRAAAIDDMEYSGGGVTIMQLALMEISSDRLPT